MLGENLGRIPIFIAISAICAMLLSSSFGMQSNQGAWAGTFPGENGQIAFRSERDGFEVSEIYVMNSDGSEQTRLTNNTAHDNSPSWSPDGTKIAFHSDRDSTEESRNFEIYVMNSDGSEQTRLTDEPDAADVLPSWSPDGTKIAFVSDRDTNREIYVMNADGSEPTNISNNAADDDEPSWSPDGTKIAFMSTRDDVNNVLDEIYVMNADDGSEPTRLTNNTAQDFRPSWSPDGTKIAFMSTRDGGSEIYVMNADDGSEQTRLTNNDNAEDFPSWSPDGTKIAFASDRDLVFSDINEIYVMNADDGSEQTRLTNNDLQDDNPEWGTNTSPPGGGGNGNGDTPAEIIDELISTIENLDDNVPQSVKTSLIALLEELLNILNDNNPNNDELVCGTLDAFINQINAIDRRDILTADEANELSTQAEDIRNALDC